MRNSKFKIQNPAWRAMAVLLGLSVLLGWVYLTRAALPARPESRPAAAGGTFVPVELYLDAGGSELGSYQVELTAKNATIVGLEGGESKAFQDAPYYDPAALMGNKIIVASFSTDENLPKGQTRIARLHMMLTAGSLGADGLPEMTSKLIVATDGQGKSLTAKLTLKPMQGESR